MYKPLFSFALLAALPASTALAAGPGQPAPDDPKFSLQWGLEQANDVDVNAVTAWEMLEGRPFEPVVVAVIDTAIDTGHPDLRDRIWINPDEIAGNGIDDDENGFVDDVRGWDFRNDDNSSFDGIMVHGTPVAGIIAAEADNAYSSAGVCGTFPVSIMPLQIVNIDEVRIDENTDPEDLRQIATAALEAVIYAVDNGADVINMSLGTVPLDEAFTRQLNEVIAYAEQNDVLVVAASGNSGTEDPALLPAALDYDHIVSVGSIDQNGLLADHSNFGVGVNVAAPGVSINTTFPTFDMISPAFTTGTSFAAPFVSGIAALARGACADCSAYEIRDAILAGSPAAGLSVETGGYVRAPLVLEALGIPLPDGRDAEGRINRPTAAFSQTLEGDRAPLVAEFDASLSFDANDEIVAYRWDFGDGSFGEGQLAQHTFTRGGVFHARLEVEDAAGHVDISPPVRVTVKSPEIDAVEIRIEAEVPIVLSGELLDGDISVRTGAFWGRFTRGEGTILGPDGQEARVIFETRSSWFKKASGSVTVEINGQTYRSEFRNRDVNYNALTRTTSMELDQGDILSWSVSDNR